VASLSVHAPGLYETSERAVGWLAEVSCGVDEVAEAVAFQERYFQTPILGLP